jgi:hypothetical protein
MATVSDDQVRERLATVKRLIDRFDMAVAQLTQEEKELEVTLRVVERFDNRPSFDDLLAQAPQEVRAPPPSLVVHGKPENAPTMPNMIEEVLRRQVLFGLPGLKPKEITDKIRELWWPEAPTTSVSPIAWRMWRDGRLVKTDDVYSVPNEETPAGETAGASERGVSQDPSLETLSPEKA